jgi:hypothetical protein
LVAWQLSGSTYPNVRIKSKAEDRKTEILNGFPDALDLMLVCVEAGLGIDACFARVGQEIIDLHPRLSELFATVSLELRAGRPRAEALKNMAKRSGVRGDCVLLHAGHPVRQARRQHRPGAEGLCAAKCARRAGCAPRKRREAARAAVHSAGDVPSAVHDRCSLAACDDNDAVVWTSVAKARQNLAALGALAPVRFWLCLLFDASAADARKGDIEGLSQQRRKPAHGDQRSRRTGPSLSEGRRHRHGRWKCTGRFLRASRTTSMP